MKLTFNVVDAPLLCVTLICTLGLSDTATIKGESQQLPARVGEFPQERKTFYTTAEGVLSNEVRAIAVAADGSIIADTAEGLLRFHDGAWQATDDRTALTVKQALPAAFAQHFARQENVTIARFSPQQAAVGTQDGLYLVEGNQPRQLFPTDADRRWAPSEVSVAFDEKGKLWFASRQGVGCLDEGKWRLFTGGDGLPSHELTCVTCGPDGSVWFGSRMGAIRFDGKHWAYRQGQRWLPNDDVRDIALAEDGSAWIATAGGIAHIHFRTMSLAEKAKFYEDEIDARHRRTEFGYVIEATTPEAGKKDQVRLSDSDNDGLWTSMYGAGECFAYGATKDPLAKRRARAAFEALRFLSEAPKDSRHAPPAGFIARTVVEAANGNNPNAGGYSLEVQRRQQQHDQYWRVYEPRWPLSANGHYYWKSDTSSDELDGHYFFYARYYDLVAETEAEKKGIRDVVRANIDHLIEHDFSLHDHAGRTRWAVYDPRELNHNPEWFVERGLNSLSMLSYLNVAHHVTGDEKYQEVAAELRDKHSYHMNLMWPKYQRGIGSGNQSDDEMAFMSFYNLIMYEPDPQLKRLYTVSFGNLWRLEEPEMNPFFNFCYAALANEATFTNIWGTYELSPWPSWLADSIETLERFPLDRFNWRHDNSRRADIVTLTDHSADVFRGQSRGRGYRVNRKVIPVDERYFNHWNHDPWQLQSGQNGHVIGTGAVFTLPYYMGLYHGFIVEGRKR